jgi:hypothetical protein
MVEVAFEPVTCNSEMTASMHANECLEDYPDDVALPDSKHVTEVMVISLKDSYSAGYLTYLQ